MPKTKNVGKAIVKYIRWWLRSRTRRYFPLVYAKRQGLIPYTKARQTPSSLVSKLRRDGLAVANPAQAELFLEASNYFRFKVYLRPFLVGNTKNFIAGSSFDDAMEIYEFDAELRNLVMRLTGCAEINLRHLVDTAIGTHTADPFWYTRKDIYQSFPERTIEGMKGNFLKSTEEFSEHYSKKYYNPASGLYALLPPFWLISETLTIGSLHYIVKSLNKDFFSASGSGVNALDDLARKVGAFNIGHLIRWLEFTRNLRNWAAHHSRLWNRHMAEPPNISRNLDKRIAGPVPTAHRIYYHLVMLRVMLKSQPTSAVMADVIKPTLQALFAKYPVVDRLKAHMGFPPNWHVDPFWV